MLMTSTLLGLFRNLTMLIGKCFSDTKETIFFEFNS